MREIHRHGGELSRGAALQKEDAVVLGNREQLAEQALGLLGRRHEGLAAVADLEHRHARALPVGQLLADLAQDLHGQRGRPRGEIEYAHDPSQWQSIVIEVR